MYHSVIFHNRNEKGRKYAAVLYFFFLKNEYLSSLNNLQREEEMNLIDKLEQTQKCSQSFDDCRSMLQHCFDKCSLNELIQLKEKLFDQTFQQFQNSFQFELINEKREKIEFRRTSNEDFQQVIQRYFGELLKPKSKENSSPMTNVNQVIIMNFSRRTKKISSCISEWFVIVENGRISVFIVGRRKSRSRSILFVGTNLF